jgi:hypothetical protein
MTHGTLKFAVRLFLLFLFGISAASQDSDRTQLAKAFELRVSPQLDYAKDRVERTFYVQLQVNNLRPNLKDRTCVHSGFLSWVRKFFRRDAKTITLVATVTGPDRTVQKVPLFEISKDEGTPPQCITDVLTGADITPLYVASRGGNFRLDVQALTKQAVTISAAKTTVAAGASLLSFTGGSAWLLQNVATSQAAVRTAADAVDASLSGTWSQSDQETYRFDLNSWPANEDWDRHVDEAVFSVGSLAAAAGGIRVDPTLLPTVSISLHYVPSVFGGPRHYLSEDDILATNLTVKGGNPLGDLFKLGVSGFTTDQAMTITEPNAMRLFCSSMRSNFANFLTTSDALAARHAVLLRRTNFYDFAKLRETAGCESQREVEQLKKLNANFEFPADIGRTDSQNRSEFVQKRGKGMLSPALRGGSKDTLTRVLADPAKFTLLISSDVRAVFPDVADGRTWGDVTGTLAIDQLIQAGRFRTGCWNALPNQNLRNMVGVAVNEKTGQSAAITVEFDADYPGPGSNPSSDKGKVTKISFRSIEAIQSVANLSGWPDESCELK